MSRVTKNAIPHNQTKYFVAHLLSGEVAEYHRALTRELARQFHIAPLHEKLTPHITVKIPFETDEPGIREVASRLAHFTAARTPEPVRFSGFGRFGFKTIYLDVAKTSGAVTLVRDCIAELDGVPRMQRAPLEGNKLHASVARFLTYKQFRSIWRLLAHTNVPRFEHSMNSIAIMKKEPSVGVWQVLREFRFGETERMCALAKPPRVRASISTQA